MGVIYIGDRTSGKTHLALELANPQSNYVKVNHPDYQQIKSLLYDTNLQSTTANINVQLPSRQETSCRSRVMSNE